MTAQEQGEVRIQAELDIAVARGAVRDVATLLGFSVTETARIVTAASELGRNVYKYAGNGVMRWRALRNGEVNGVELCFEDHGPGIPDVSEALREGYGTGGGLGMGLPGAKRLMDEIEIHSVVGEGTTVTVRKWQQR